MGVSFTRKLSELEKYLNSSDFVVSKKDSDFTKEDYKRHLKKLINFVEEGSFATTETEKFICKNYRKDLKSLSKMWNKTHPNEQKKYATLSSQVWRLSKKFYCIFGEDFENKFLQQDAESVRLLSDTINAIYFETDIDFDNVFVDDVYHYCDSYSVNSYDISEIGNELSVLRSLLTKNILLNLDLVDKDKLCYILEKLASPVVGESYADLNKIKIQISNTIYTLRNENGARINLPLKFTSKLHVNSINDDDGYVVEPVETSEGEIYEGSSELSESDSDLVDSSAVAQDIDNESEEYINQQRKIYSVGSTQDGDSLFDDDMLDIGFEVEEGRNANGYIWGMFDVLHDYVGNTKVEMKMSDLKTAPQEKRKQAKAIHSLLSLLTYKGMKNYLDASGFDRELFGCLLEGFETSFEASITQDN